MRTLQSVFSMVILLVLVYAGNQELFASEKIEKGKTRVYYFHNTRRCPTCMAIEEETKKVLEEQPFADDMENGNLELKVFNVEEEANKKIVEQMGVTGSALIVVKGDEQIDLTSKGFLYALKQPEKLREALREALID